MIMEILTGSGGDSVLFARYTGGDSVLVSKKEWGGFCPGGILSCTRFQHISQCGFVNLINKLFACFSYENNF